MENDINVCKEKSFSKYLEPYLKSEGRKVLQTYTDLYSWEKKLAFDDAYPPPNEDALFSFYI